LRKRDTRFILNGRQGSQRKNSSDFLLPKMQKPQRKIRCGVEGLIA